MKTNVTRTALCFISMFILSIQLHSQDSVKTVILSSRVGKQIERAERDQFKIFNPFKDFESAVIYQRPDSSFFVVIVLKENGGVKRDTTVEYSEGQVFAMAEKIRHFEGLVDGSYFMGSEPTILKTTDGKLIEKKGVEPGMSKPQTYNQGTVDRLPLTPGSVDEDIMDDQSPIGLGFGISRYSPDYSGLVYKFLSHQPVPRKEESMS